jgi:zinc protease
MLTPHRRWTLLGLLVVALASAPALAQRNALPAGLTEVTQVEGITEYRLANGLQVLLVPDDAKPTTTVNVTYRVGSRHENYGETGMAHLLEHLIFKGTPTTRNVLGELTKRGMRANGTTSFDRTNYFASFAANDDNLRWYLGWQADAMVNSFIARADLDTEMTVVRNEMESGENSPSRILIQRTLAAMYAWHNYGKDTIGARSDVENVDISRLQAFYRKYYQPDNATLIVAGKFDTAKVLGWVAQSFGPLPRPQRKLQPTYTLEPVQDGERTVTLRRVGGTPVIFAGFPVMPASHPDYAAVELLTLVLGDRPAGRLHKRLVQTGLAANAFSFSWDAAEPGPMFVGASLGPGQDVERARTELLATVDALTTEPVTAEELERARTQALNGWELGFTDPESIGVAISGAIALGDWRLFFLQRDHVRRVTVADVNRVAAQWLRRDNRTVSVYLPTEQPERAPAPARVDVAALVQGYRGDAGVAQAESFVPTPANLDARTQQFTLASGMKAALLPKGTRGRVVQARLRLHYGDETSLRGLETVADFTTGLLDKGVTGLNRQQISDALDKLRAELRLSASDQTVTANLTTTREHLPAVIELLGRLLRQPEFPADALEEARRQAQTGIERQRQEPGALVANTLSRHGNPYPRGDIRYAPTFEESAQDLSAVTIEQVRDFHRRFYSAAQAQFSAVGDFDAGAVRQALESAFGDWQAPATGAQPYARVSRPLLEVPPQRFVLTTPDKANANLQAELALPLNDLHPDYPALVVANHILGGGAASRLWMRVREKDGLSYDVHSFVAWSQTELNSRWVVTAIFAPQNRARVEAAVREEIARALKSGFTAREVEEARQALLGSRRLARAQDAVVASALARNLELDRRFDVSQRIDDAIAGLTLAQVNAALRRYIDPARWAIAWGGDFKTPQ